MISENKPELMVYRSGRKAGLDKTNFEGKGTWRYFVIYYDLLNWQWFACGCFSWQFILASGCC